jgi:CTD kinase subunit beta
MAPAEVVGNGVAEHQSSFVGPHPGRVKVPRQYFLEQEIRQMLVERAIDPAKEDRYRLEGVQLIHSLRQSIKLCVFPMRFRVFRLG